jgi:hypothetical protein
LEDILNLILVTVNGVQKPYWNVSANVGLASPNRPDDVELVQFGYYAMLNNPKVEKTDEQRQAFSKIIPGQRCNGTAADPLVAAILAHEKARGQAQDGHVSSITNGGVYRAADGRHTFLMLALNANMYDLVPDAFPRIDRHPQCPPQVAQLVKRTCSL